jgi:chromosome segregation ATPase
VKEDELIDAVAQIVRDLQQTVQRDVQGLAGQVLTLQEQLLEGRATVENLVETAAAQRTTIVAQHAALAETQAELAETRTELTKVRASMADAQAAMAEDADARDAGVAETITGIEGAQAAFASELAEATEQLDRMSSALSDDWKTLETRLTVVEDLSRVADLEAGLDGLRQRLGQVESRTLAPLATDFELAESVSRGPERLKELRGMMAAEVKRIDENLGKVVQRLDRLKDGFEKKADIDHVKWVDTRCDELEAALETRLTHGEADQLQADVQAMAERAAQRGEEALAALSGALTTRVDGLASSLGGIDVSVERLKARSDAFEAWAEGKDAWAADQETRTVEVTTAATLANAMIDELRAENNTREDDLVRLRDHLVERYSAVDAWARGGEAYKALALVHHQQGLWQAIRRTVDEPSTQSPDWMLLADGVKDVRIERDDDQTAAFVVERTSGHEAAFSFRLPVPRYRGVWNAETEYQAWDSVVRDMSGFLALVDSPTAEPGVVPGEWQVFTGARGRKGVKGDRGEPGPVGEPGAPGEVDLAALIEQVSAVVAADLQQDDLK